MKHSLLASLVLIVLAGCTQPYQDFATSSVLREQADKGLDARAYRAVDAMLNAAPDLTAEKTPMVVGSVEDIQDVNSSTPFGNVISELVRSRLVQHGVRVADLRVRSSVLLDRGKGEMLLGRDRRSLLPPPMAADIVTGTYAVASNKVYVSLKVIAAADARIIAASDFVTERTTDVNRLLLQDPFAR
jgi:hypothetical protein